MDNLTAAKRGYMLFTDPIIPLEFTRSTGKSYRIVGVEFGDNYSHLSAIDHVKSLETGRVNKMTRKQLLKFIE